MCLLTSEVNDVSNEVIVVLEWVVSSALQDFEVIS